MSESSDDPYKILGVSNSASQEETRSAYLKLVREFPPDRDPDRFRAIYEAYQKASDPLIQANSMLNITGRSPNLLEVIDDASKKLPFLSRLSLLALGNQD